jgi:N-acetylglucosaminyldiphosphoundecaprenol N-acetyl-beta-D-mannosaminyltransferase
MDSGDGAAAEKAKGVSTQNGRGWVPTPLHFGSGTPRPLGRHPLSNGEMPAIAHRPTEPWQRADPVVVLGVAFDPMTLASAADCIEHMIASRSPHYVVTPNVDFLVQARRDTELHRILAGADLVLCDGKPLVWAAQWLGGALPCRVAGSDLVPVLLQRAAERGWRIFLLGGSEEAAEAAARRIAAAHPTLPAVAHYSPPHAPLDQMNHAEIARRVQAAQPDLMLVCFGCPKQEKWMARHCPSLGVPVMIGAGGTVDFLAGRLKRAPVWMRRTGTEWLYRLSQEPRRLFKRYADDLLHFLPPLLAIHSQLRRLKKPAPDP